MLSATVAPIGSMKMPSNARTDSSGCFGRITASRGVLDRHVGARGRVTCDGGGR